MVPFTTMSPYTFSAALLEPFKVKEAPESMVKSRQLILLDPENAGKFPEAPETSGITISSELVGTPLSQFPAVFHHALVAPDQVVTTAKLVWKNKNDMKSIIVART